MPKIFTYLRYMLRIRRIEFRVAEIPIIAIPVLLTVRNASFLQSFTFWEGVFVFFLLFAFGDMINCLADRDLDAVYKPHLSEAVYGLGLRSVIFQIAASAILAVILSVHLSWYLNRWLITVFTVCGLMLGAAYSVKPVQLKSRGVLQLICLWAIIFFFPIIYVSLFITSEISMPLAIFAGFYGAAQMGIILINTAEDYPEDLDAGIHTTIVTLGLHRGILTAFWLTLIGSIGSLCTLIWFYSGISSVPIWWLGLLPAAAGCAFVILAVRKVYRRIDGLSLNESIASVKLSARAVPLWVTIVAWSMLWSCALVFYSFSD